MIISKMWYSVETPTVFREYLLPTDESRLTAKQKKQLKELEKLAAKHLVTIIASHTERG